MRDISAEEFENTKPLIILDKSKLINIKDDQVEWERLLKEMDKPAEMQKELAVKMKIFVDEQIERDIKEYNQIRDNTRKFIQDYNNILSMLNKNLYGDKTQVDINISNSMIASKIRQASKVIDVKEE